MIPRIYFYANCGDMKKLPLGGGEVGNRRTLELFHEIGYQVVHIEKYRSLRLQNKFFNVLTVSVLAFCNLIVFFFTLLFGRRKMSVVHISAFYGQMVYFEYLLVAMSKLMGYKTVYEMRGGGAEMFYKDGSKIYRKTFDTIVNRCDCIFSQGMENFELLNSINPDKEVFYYPNCVDNEFMPKSYSPKPKDSLNLIYFGRLSIEKNINLIIDIAKNIRVKYSNTILTLVGQFKTEEYQKSILGKIENENLSNFVKVLPKSPKEYLTRLLSNAHFFIFPSSEPREGHSNSLTEAMAYGVVPIASNQGFSKSVIDDDHLIVNSFDMDNYTKAIIDILSIGQYENVSHKMYERVRKNYTCSVVSCSFRKEYEKILETVSR